jgi:hypothetical protein
MSRMVTVNRGHGCRFALAGSPAPFQDTIPSAIPQERMGKQRGQENKGDVTENFSVTSPYPSPMCCRLESATAGRVRHQGFDTPRHASLAQLTASGYTEPQFASMVTPSSARW